MVFVEQSPADALLGPLNEFAQNLEKRLKPNLEFQKAMQKAIAANPKLAVDLAGLEKNAPGTLQAMGFGDLGNIISGIPEDITSQFQRENRNQILQTQKTGLDVTQGEQGLTLDRVNRTIDLLKSDPSVGRDQILRELTGQTTAQQDLTKASARSATARAAEDEAQLPGILAESEVKNKMLQTTLEKYPTLSQYDPVRIVKDIIRGKSVPDFANFLTLPGANEAVQHAQSIIDLQERLDQQKELRALTNRQINAEERAKIQSAATLLRQTKAGTLDAWRTVLEDPEQVVKVQDKLKAAQGNMAALTQPERDVLHAADAQNEQQDIITDRQRRADEFEFNQSIKQAEINLRKDPSPANAALILSPLNSSLVQRTKQYGGEIYQARYGKVPAVGDKEGTTKRSIGHPFGGNEGLYFVDKDGNRVEDAAVYNLGKTGLSTEAAQALVVAQSLKPGPDRDKALEQLKKAHPDIYNAIITRIK